MSHSSDHLRTIHNFKELLQYLEDKLGWPLREYEFDDLTFEYDPEDLGLKDEDAAKVKAIHQLRPLQHGQPWGIFFVEFEKKKLPVVVLRRILSHLVVKKRASANRASEAAWHADDLLFVTAFGDEETAQREIAFAHFHQAPGDLPTLRVLGWDGGDTPLKLSHLDTVLRQRLCWPDDPADHKSWREQWRSPFKHRLGHVIRTADALAEALAALARGINAKAKRMLAAETDNGPLRKLHKAFQAALIHDLTEESFADTYAQTITYGLLTAAISRTEGSGGRHGTFIVAENVTDMVPITNPFLKEMLQTFLKVGGRKGGIDFDELGIQDVVDLLRGDETDIPAILRDFGNKTQGEDPVIHFYEHFLAAYNKKLKVQRGVFYTPKPVVSYIVRSVHELLQTEFGLEDGLASTVTWGEMAQIYPPRPQGEGRGEGGIKIPDGVSSDSPFVKVLDPATGTATFLVEVIDVIHKTMMARWRKNGKRDAEIGKLWNEYVPKHLLPRLYGYELMMAPYAIAHMKIGLKLFETGYQFMSDERVRVYLTNALEPASDEQQKLMGILPALAHEAEAVNAVKREVRFTVVVGNPPYSVLSANLTDTARKIVGLYRHVDGQKVEERSMLRLEMHLQDDYIKFLAFSQYVLQQARVGVLGMITNNGYLDNLTLRGVRYALCKQFHDLTILNLHGSRQRRNRVEETLDDNVFDIEQGVAITTAIESAKVLSGTKAHYAEIFGVSELKAEYLLGNTVGSIEKQSIIPNSPYYFLTPRDESRRPEYDNYISVTEAMPVNISGIVTAHDNLVVDFDDARLKENASILRSDKIDDEKARKLLNVKDNAGWKLTKVRREFRKTNGDASFLMPYAYRPFDERRIYYQADLVWCDRRKVMSHTIADNNVALATCRQLASEPWEHLFVTRQLQDDCFISNRTRERSYHFPLYLYEDMLTSSIRRPNLSPSFLKAFARALNVKQAASHSLPQGLTPEDILHYIYAVFYSPGYRTRYSEFLKIDFPRVPLTSRLELFRSLSNLGNELVALHLLESPTVNNFITTFTGKGDNSIPKKPTWKDNAVWINPTQRFEGVPENVWYFHIGGYQVCEKWLKDRKGRTLSDDDIAHYQRIVVALNETIRIMTEIDRVIDEHGGWPIQ